MLGTRPEIIRLSRTIALLDDSVDHVLVHTGQNSHFELNEVFFRDLEIRRPDYFLGASTSSVATFLAEALTLIDPILQGESPDAFLALGDTNSALTAILAKKMQIPIYHLEAGNRSFDANVPEEVNRRVIDHLADFNFPYSETARRNLLDEGLEPRRTILSGSPLPEILHHFADRIEQSDVLSQCEVESDKYFIVSAHRQENIDSPVRLRQLLDMLNGIGDRFGLPILMSTHPRTLDKLSKSPEFDRHESIRFHEPFGFFDYVRLQREAFCVLSDSGTVSEEASIVGFPAVTIRSAIERPEAQESGVLVLSDLSLDRTLTCVDWIRANWRNMESPRDYEIRNFSHRIVSAILSTAPSHKTWSGLR